MLVNSLVQVRTETIFGRPVMANSERIVDDGAVDVTEACRFTGIGRSFLYGLMDAGQLNYVKLGKRRLIPRAELKRLLAESLKAGRHEAAAPPTPEAARRRCQNAANR
jgi:excisionase family DNA binding protein